MILLLALPLVGCDAGQQLQQHLAQCLFDAESNYPRATWLAGDERQSYVSFCMAAHGYTLNRTQRSCAEKIYRAPEAALYVQCYEPSARLSLLLHKLKALAR